MSEELADGSVVRLDYDGGLEPTHGIYITVEVKNAMQHTIKRAELTASLRHHKSMCGSCHSARGQQGHQW